MTRKWISTIVLFVLIQLTVTVYSQKYKVTLKSIEICPEGDPPYDKEKPLTLNVMGYNKSDGFYFRGNVTIRQNLKGYYHKIKTGVAKSDGGIQYMNQYKKLTCKSMIPKVILMSSGVRYNEKTCEIYKGDYTFNKIDINKLQPGAYYFPIKEMGESVVYYGIYSGRGTTMCTLARYVLRAN